MMYVRTAFYVPLFLFIPIRILFIIMISLFSFLSTMKMPPTMGWEFCAATFYFSPEGRGIRRKGVTVKWVNGMVLSKPLSGMEWQEM